MVSHVAEREPPRIAGLSRRGVLIAVSSLVAIELIVGSWMFLAKKLSAPEIDIPGITVFSPPEELPRFTLTDHTRKVFDNDRLRGKWTLAAFGYTSCPDFCPTTLAEMARLFQQIAQVPATAADTQFVFISVDPYRDTYEQLAGYVTYFRSDFVGVTGAPEQLHQLTSQIGSNFEYVDRATDRPIRDILRKPASDDYIVDHYSGLLLIDPAGRLIATLLPPFAAEQTFQAYLTLRNYYGGIS